MTDRDKYEMDKLYHKSKVENKTDIDIYRKKVSLKYLYMNSFTRKNALFSGKVPKSGFFSVRQVIADEWLQLFIKLIELTLGYLYVYSDDKTGYALFPQLYIVGYLIKQYPEDFAFESNENEYLRLMMAIPQFFTNPQVSNIVKRTLDM